METYESLYGQYEFIDTNDMPEVTPVNVTSYLEDQYKEHQMRQIVNKVIKILKAHHQDFFRFMGIQGESIHKVTVGKGCLWVSYTSNEQLFACSLNLDTFRQFKNVLKYRWL